jgi:NTP pyrophosphatase (non-canonical NTP hydrolase)
MSGVFLNGVILLCIENHFHSMTFEEYQKRANSTAGYPDSGNNFLYPTLGLVGEAGEVANKIKKIQRDLGNIVDEAYRKDILKELGDVLWYVSQLAREFQSNLEEVALLNIEKLASRRDRKTLGGSGDDR